MIVTRRFVSVFAGFMMRVVMRLVMMILCTFVLVLMVVVFVLVIATFAVMMIMLVIATFAVMMIMVVVMREVDIELDPRDALPFILADVQMKAIELKFLQLVRQFVRVHTEIKHRADEHIAADAAEDIEIKSFHFQIDVSPTTARWHID